jgi:nucleotide-binding universal stress UspA family protein
MFKHLLIPTDGSATAQKAVDAGINLARDAGARVTVFTAVPEYPLPGQSAIMAHQQIQSLADYEREQRARAGAFLEQAASRARGLGVDCDADVAFCDRPWQAIVGAARSHACDLIVIASHGRKGLAALWYGSETEEVLTHSDIPTLVYR